MATALLQLTDIRIRKKKKRKRIYVSCVTLGDRIKEPRVPLNHSKAHVEQDNKKRKLNAGVK